MSRRDDRLCAAALERDRQKRQRMLSEVASGILRAADRRRRKPAPKKPREPEPPAANGKWRPLGEGLRTLMSRRRER